MSREDPSEIENFPKCDKFYEHFANCFTDKAHKSHNILVALFISSVPNDIRSDSLDFVLVSFPDDFQSWLKKAKSWELVTAFDSHGDRYHLWHKLNVIKYELHAQLRCILPDEMEIVLWLTHFMLDSLSSLPFLFIPVESLFPFDDGLIFR